MSNKEQIRLSASQIIALFQSEGEFVEIAGYGPLKVISDMPGSLHYSKEEDYYNQKSTTIISDKANNRYKGVTYEEGSCEDDMGIYNDSIFL